MRGFHQTKYNKIDVRSGVLKIELGSPLHHFKQGSDGINHFDLGMAALLHFMSFPPMRIISLLSNESYTIPPLTPFRYLPSEAVFDDTFDSNDFFVID